MHPLFFLPMATVYLAGVFAPIVMPVAIANYNTRAVKEFCDKYCQ